MANVVRLRTEVFLRSIEGRAASILEALLDVDPTDDVVELERLARQCRAAVAACRRSEFDREMLVRLSAKVTTIEARVRDVLARAASRATSA